MLATAILISTGAQSASTCDQQWRSDTYVCSVSPLEPQRVHTASANRKSLAIRRPGGSSVAAQDRGPFIHINP